MTWARTRSEMEPILCMRQIVDDVLLNVLTYSHERDLDVSLFFDRCANCYWYRGWAGWIADISFERRLRHLNKWEESVFTRWQNKQIFAVTIERRPGLYKLVPDWWYDFSEMPLVSNGETNAVYVFSFVDVDGDEGLKPEFWCDVGCGIWALRFVDNVRRDVMGCLSWWILW